MSRTKEKINKQIKKQRKRSYIARDFDSFRAELYDYATTYFGDRIRDFSEASIGGLLLDMAAMVGDTMSFYLDHQFNELNWENAIETKNIQTHLRLAGVKQSGVSPAVVGITFTMSIPSVLLNGAWVPRIELLPTIGEGTVVSGGVTNFSTTEDLHMWETDRLGQLVAKVTTEKVNTNGEPEAFLVEKEIICISGNVAEQSFVIPNVHIPFRKIVISNHNITDIISVVDSEGNEYFEVDSLSQDTVYRGILNIDDDDNLVKKNLEIVPAPYRFIAFADHVTGITTIQFGSGNADSIDDDLIPDPSDISLPLYGKKTFSRFSIDPSSMLQTQTLGVSPKNTTITVKYRYGGGISHNIAPNSVIGVETSFLTWPLLTNPTPEQFALQREVKNSINVFNDFPAAGGAAAQDIEELRAQIPAARTMQSRIVTKDDLLARVHTLPSDFGRVFRAGIHQNPNNPLSAELFIVCLNNLNQLCIAPDSLKKNLRVYLNEHRLISDAIDILDASIINFKIDFAVVIDPQYVKKAVLQIIISKLKDVTRLKMFQIDQPIVLTDLMNIVINTEGVLSLTGLSVTTRRGLVEDRVYSDMSFNIKHNTRKGLIIGPPGSIFEMRYPDYDIVGSAI